MKYLLLLIIIPLLSASECGKHKKNEPVKEEIKETMTDTTSLTDSLPACVRKIINDGHKEFSPNLPLKVDEYLYKGKTVFYVTAPCCDFYNMVYDDSCKTICGASGGFTGRGDGKCPDFSKEAKFVKQIWKQGE
jgi:hypothetical protein